jgi:hypothetical protein
VPLLFKTLAEQASSLVTLHGDVGGGVGGGGGRRGVVVQIGAVRIKRETASEIQYC